MRDLKKLYVVLLKFYKKNNKGNERCYGSGGYICNTIDDLKKKEIISKEEFELLFEHFKKQRPTKDLYPKFYNSLLYNRASPVWFNWYDYRGYYELGINDDSLGVNIRIALLKAIINTLD